MDTLPLLGLTGIVGIAFVAVSIAKTRVETQAAEDKPAAQTDCAHSCCCRGCAR